MVLYDLVILAILVYGAWQGAARGLVMQLAWIAAIILCFKFADKLAPQIETHIGFEPPLRHWVAMFILYLGFSLGSFLAARSLSNVLEKAKFQDFDRHLGGVFGLLKGAILSLVLTFFAVTLSEPLQETVVRSKTGYIACRILDQIGPLIPEDAHPRIRESLTKYQKALKQIHVEHEGEEASPEEALEDLLGGRSSIDGSGSESKDDFQFSGRGATANPSTSLTYDALLATLPESMRNQFSLASVRDRWNRMTTEDRERWVTDLKYATSTEKTRLLSSLFDLVSGQGGATSTPIDSTLVDLIADEYREDDDPGLVAIRIKQYLNGIPDLVQVAVLEDWYADLTGNGRDPDQRTEVNTRIDDRILNQLRKARVSVEQLSYDLQTRLQQRSR